MTDIKIQKMIDLAKSQVGYHEGYSNGHWNNIEKYAPTMSDLSWAQGQPWCAVFVSWLSDQCGTVNNYPRTASVASAHQWGLKNGTYSEYPAIGAWIIYGNDVHTGFVIGYDDKYVYSIEGNTNTNGSPEGDGVYSKSHIRTDNWVKGYVYPVGLQVQSADPAYNKTITSPVPPNMPLPNFPNVSLSRLIQSSHIDPPSEQGHQSYPEGVKIVESALLKEGLLSSQYAYDGSFGLSTIKAYSQWQYRLGYRGSNADGIPGITSLTTLGKKYGFKVTK